MDISSSPILQAVLVTLAIMWERLLSTILASAKIKLINFKFEQGLRALFFYEHNPDIKHNYDIFLLRLNKHK
jgi:hypothetical protein